jgi:hypothetical protein
MLIHRTLPSNGEQVRPVSEDCLEIWRRRRGSLGFRRKASPHQQVGNNQAAYDPMSRLNCQFDDQRHTKNHKRRCSDSPSKPRAREDLVQHNWEDNAATRGPGCHNPHGERTTLCKVMRDHSD